MNRVLTITHADCGHVAVIGTDAHGDDGTSRDIRARAERLLSALHAAGHNRYRIRSRDSKDAALSLLEGTCDACRVDLATLSDKDLAAALAGAQYVRNRRATDQAEATEESTSE